MYLYPKTLSARKQDLEEIKTYFGLYFILIINSIKFSIFDLLKFF